MNSSHLLGIAPSELASRTSSGASLHQHHTKPYNKAQQYVESELNCPVL